jgi:hypothetical protein
MKGPLGAVFQILVTVGIMISFFLGLPIPDFPTDDDPNPDFDYSTFEVNQYWRIMFALPIAFAFIQSVLLLTVFNYETPRFLK